MVNFLMRMFEGSQFRASSQYYCTQLTLLYHATYWYWFNGVFPCIC